ncbi:MAG: DUF4493 domain-containing protein [Muribaculaceae bacterium]|nr:DUF4493 domain-containing protein [Muribaculaceae bacterium]
MNRVSSVSLLCGALLALASCGTEDCFRQDGPEGKVTLDLTTDGSVRMNTRADDTKVSVIPQPSQFRISFEKHDGTFAQEWASLNHFNKESSFPIGSYTLSASYGDKTKEGFELPCFDASTEVMVESGVESHVALTATLSNAMVSVRYSEDFKSQFLAYSSALKAESSADYVIFAQDEDRPAYMKPEKISLTLTLTNNQGQQVKVSPYSFIASPQHHYIVTMGIKDSQGSDDIRLDVQITEEVTAEFVDISLGDELFTAPKPSVKAYDFPNSMRYEDFEGFEADGDPRVDVLAYGGLRSVNVNVKSAEKLIFGETVQLVNADALTQQQVASTGLEAEGFFRNPEKAGVIKFKNFLAKLPVGTYTISVDVQDARTIVCDEPVAFDVTIKPVTVKLSVAKFPEYMGEEMDVTVTSNKPGIKNNIRFEVADHSGNWTEATILSAPAAVKTRADQTYTYSYHLSIPAQERSYVKVRAYYGSETDPKDQIQEEGVIFPKYSVVTDAFAKKVYMKIIPEDPSKLDIIMKTFKVLREKEETPEIYDEENGIFLLQGLYAATDYSGWESYLSYGTNPRTAIPAFRTEAASDIANGTFDDEKNTLTLNFNDIQVGGQYSVWPGNYTLKSSIERYTPNEWATLNDLTCWSGSSNRNTWFMVPSTYSENGKVVIQTVGYSHNGTTPSKSGGAGNNKYYCENSPSDADLQKSRGELFLGSYSYDGTAHRVDGISWNTRPQMLTFDYSYDPLGAKMGEAYIKILDASGEEIVSESAIIPAGENQTMTVVLPDYPFGVKAAKLILGFKSTRTGLSATVNIPTGSQLNENQSLGNHTLKANSYHAVALGSKLTIDNVKLGYDPVSTESEAKHSKGNKTKIVKKVVKSSRK